MIVQKISTNIIAFTGLSSIFCTPMAYIEAFSDGLRPFMVHIKDVIANGNYGFRAIFDLMGMSEDGWIKVRKDLLNELKSRLDHYTQLYGIFGQVDELIHALSFCKGSVPHDR